MKRIFHVTVLSLAFVSFLKAQTITTIAGNGTAGYNGDNKAATIATLNQPANVRVDATGNIYVADFMNSRIRKIDANGFISTTAGTGSASFNGDGLLATNTNLNWPETILFDAVGNTYIEDTYNHRIRRINTSGYVSTVAGNGFNGYSGDNALAVNASLSYPSNGLAFDNSGNLYISDSYNNRIRKVDLQGNITTIAGTGVAGYNGDGILATTAKIYYPYAIAFDAADNLYFADGLNHRIRKISTSGIITTVAGTGNPGYNGDNISATSAEINRPIGLVFDGAGNLFIAEGSGNRIRKINTSGVISTIAGNGNTGYNGDNIPASLATLTYPNGLAVDLSGNLIVAELGAHRIRKISNAAIILPLSLTGFTAQLQNSHGYLQWQTSNEINTKKFIIEVSTDNRTFSALDSVKAKNTAGTNVYSFVDKQLRSGVTYYRLKIVDRDGKISISQIVSLRIGKEIQAISIAPNPAKDFANIIFSAKLVGDYALRVMDMNGKLVKQQSGKAIQGTNNIILELSHFASGTYSIIITFSDKTTTQTMFIKD